MNSIKYFFILAIIVLIAAGIVLFSKPQVHNEINLPKQKNMKITSSVFENNQFIPEKYTCQGENVNPPLEFKDVSANSKSLVLVVDDPDAPAGIWTHWLIWNIDPKATFVIGEKSFPKGSVVGRNTSGNNKYDGPCPPSGTHRYFFKLYALDSYLDLDAASQKTDLEKAMSGHIIEQAELVGLCKK